MNILIIGAGAAGLMAAHLLSRQGHQITVLEARDRIGGRIHTIHEGGFSQPVDLGAEFVHGDLPLTLHLLKEAGITYHKQEGRFWHFRQGRFYEEEENTEHWGELMKKLHELEVDEPIRSFLEKNFPGKLYDSFRESIERYVQGLDAANPDDASSFALRDEWGAENEDQYTIEGGYGRLMHYLATSTENKGAVIQLNSPINNIHWEPDAVRVETIAGKVYEAEKLIVTLPIGVLQAVPDAEGTVLFSPEIPEYLEAIQNIGSGNSLKLLLQFREAFWKKIPGHDLSELSFLLTDAAIPTWWTQYPKSSALLTGWLGGPRAYQLKDLPKEALLEKGLQSLSEIFNLPVPALHALLDDFTVTPWPAEPYTRGSYSYAKVGTPAALRILTQPVENTIYFAGEGLYYGPSMGTVEAAFTSAKAVVEAIGD